MGAALDGGGAAGDWGADFGVPEDDRGFVGPAVGDPPRGDADAEPEGRCGFGFADFDLPVCLVCGAAVMGAACPGEPGGDDTTPWPAREITAQTRRAPTTTRTSQAAAAVA
ncbi:MAG: hypothetical protein ACJ72P_16625 [Nocardioides sp.]